VWGVVREEKKRTRKKKASGDPPSQQPAFTKKGVWVECKGVTEIKNGRERTFGDTGKSFPEKYKA